MFNRVTLESTGAGIAPLVSSMTHAEPNQKINVVWSVRNPDTVLPAEIYDMIMTPRPNQDVRLWNSAEKGRADLVALTQQAVKDINSEIVVVISNPKGTQRMLDGCAALGIPCLGPILDS
jgi:ferredoxin-NADP reductase